MPQRPALSPDWTEGRYFDRWMLVHFLSGMAGGLANVFFGLAPLAVIVLGVVMMVAWELGEIALRVDESDINRVIDVVVGSVGVGLALWLAPRLSAPGQRGAFWLAFGLAAIGGIQGFRAFKQRT